METSEVQTGHLFHLFLEFGLSNMASATKDRKQYLCWGEGP